MNKIRKEKDMKIRSIMLKKFIYLFIYLSIYLFIYLLTYWGGVIGNQPVQLKYNGRWLKKIWEIYATKQEEIEIHTKFEEDYWQNFKLVVTKAS